jgi:hypothetical protein
MSLPRRAVLALSAVAATPVAEAVAETPFDTIEGLCAQIDALIARREADWQRRSYVAADGRRYARDPDGGYLRLSLWVDEQVGHLTLRVARIEARTPSEVRLKAKVCAYYNTWVGAKADDPADSILTSLYRDLGVAI